MMNEKKMKAGWVSSVLSIKNICSLVLDKIQYDYEEFRRSSEMLLTVL